MLPHRRPLRQHPLALFSLRPACGALLAAALAVPAAAHAAPEPAPAPETAPASAAPSQGAIDFSADRVDYNDKADIVTASGNVFLHRDDQTVRADTVTWNHATGKILASGHVRFVDQNGDNTFTESVELTDKFTTGTMENLILVLREGGRIAANSGTRDAEGRLHLTQAAYTSCDVIDIHGRPCSPSWRINAHRVVFTPDQNAFRMYNAHLVLFGLAEIPLPTLIVATDGRAISGLLIPNATVDSTNGLGYNQTMYTRLAPNRDVSVTGYVYTRVDPMISAQYRDLTAGGSYQITGYLTHSEVIPQGSTTNTGNNQWRGYVDANGHFQMSPEWSADFSGRLASDRTFLSRYYLSSDDVLRSNVNIQHIDADSYFSIAGWAFETLRPGELQGQVPIALPAIDYRRRWADPLLGGTIELQANSLAITRSAGQDTQRAFTSAQWSLSRMDSLGQVITFTGLLRGDVYHTTGTDLTSVAIYQGEPGWHTRGEALGAIDVSWPLVGAMLGGSQVFTPRVQVVAVPPVPAAVIPNEDSRSVELEDDNIFALNRYPGYDRIEDGVRVTYGADWQLNLPKWRVMADVGQSYRLTANTGNFPNGTGLYDRMSDVVGRTEVAYDDFFKITHRYRIDKSNLAFRRNEIDATIGTDQSYVELGYARINQGLAAAIDDLQDSNELRGAARMSFARYWSVFGSGVFDLSRSDLVTGTTPKAIQPLRTRLGLSFSSDCFEVDFTWRKDYVSIGDAATGSSFMVHFSLRNIGFK